MKVSFISNQPLHFHFRGQNRPFLFSLVTLHQPHFMFFRIMLELSSVFVAWFEYC